MAIIVPRNDFDPRILFQGFSKDDQSPYKTTGTLVASATVDPYLTLNGTDQYLTYPDVASNSLFSANQITFGAWVNFDTVDGVDQIIISKWDEGNNNRSFTLKIDATADTITSIISSDGVASSSSISTTETVTAGTDAFIVATWDGSQHRIYFDGVEVKSAQYSGGIFDGNELIALGADFKTTAQKFMDGTINQAFLAGTAFSPEMIANLALNPRGKDFHFSLPNKQLLLYERFQIPFLAKDWLVDSTGTFAIEYHNTQDKFYAKCVAGTSKTLVIPSPDWSGSNFADIQNTIAGTPTVTRNSSNVTLTMDAGDGITDIVVRRN